MRVVIHGSGLVGRRTAEFLAARADVDITVMAHSRNAAMLPGIKTVSGWADDAVAQAGVVVLATASAHQLIVAEQLIRRGISVISTADNPEVVKGLWKLGPVAADRGAQLLVGAAYSPGASSVLVAWLVSNFDEVTAIRTAQFGTGGPACAREHHRAMNGSATEVYKGRLREARAGSGRQLVWFPEPIGAADCFRAGLAEPFLLHQAFPSVDRIESRQAATRRDRLTARLPMLRPPHPEGRVGSAWVEVRGRVDGQVEHRQAAVVAPQATGAAALVAGCVGEIMGEGKRPGVYSAASLKNLVSQLKSLKDTTNDIGIWTYAGSPAVTNSGITSEQQPARKWSRIPQKYD